MSELYNEDYYKNCCGTDYGKESIWVEQFGHIADRIIADFNPKTVLDAGCAWGYLVAALRDRGVEAYGIDISSYAISKVRADIKQYCALCSLTDALPLNFPKKYDLVTNIEVLEHIYEEEGLKALKSLCSYSDNIIFSSSSSDISETTHVNVQQTEYWTRHFAEYGFFNKLDYVPNYISSVAIFLQKSSNITRVIEDYERNLRQRTSKYEDELKNYSDNVLRLDNLLASKEVQIKNISDSGLCKDEEIKKLSDVLLLKDKKVKELSDALLLKGEKVKELSGALLLNDEKVKELSDALLLNDEKVKEFSDALLLNDEKVKDLSNNLLLKDKEIKKLKELCNYKNKSIKKLSNIVNSKNEEINDLTSEIHFMTEKISNLESNISSYENEIIDYSNLVAWERGEKEFFTAAFYSISNSTIWKLTRPIRVLMDIIKKIIHQIFHNKMVETFKKTYTSFKSSGFKVTCRKIKNKLTGKPNVETLCGNIIQLDKTAINNTIKITGNPIEAIPNIITEDRVKRLNFVTDSIDANSLLGGVATALIVATKFANHYGYELRIITRTTSVNPIDYENIMRISGVESAKNISYYSDFDRDATGNKDFKLDISRDDIFFATSWWSAEAIKKTTLRKRFFYIIQEVETYFYPHGGEHYLCSQVMKDENIDFIINSHFLNEYFENNEPNITDNGTYFEPAFPITQYKPQLFEKKSKYNLFFYARPNNPRNLFSYGVRLLEKAISSGIINTNEWDIYCAGQQIPELRFSNGYAAKNMGQMSWQEYGNFLKDMDLAVSLMYTPHPSYPPFDVACSGGVVVSNKCANKEFFEQCKNVILSDLKEDRFMNSLEEGIILAKDMETRKTNYEMSTIPRSWEETLKGTITFMGEKISNV